MLSNAVFLSLSSRTEKIKKYLSAAERYLPFFRMLNSTLHILLLDNIFIENIYFTFHNLGNRIFLSVTSCQIILYEVGSKSEVITDAIQLWEHRLLHFVHSSIKRLDFEFDV